SLNRLVRLSYKNLADILVEGIKGFTMTRKQILMRHKVLNPEIIGPYKAAGKSIITLPSHYGNWEWGSLSPGLFIRDYKIIAFYKPLTNPYADRFMSRNRSRTGTELASIYYTTRTFEMQKNEMTAYIMAADQSPSNSRNAVWIEFLGRKTAFLHGPEKHAARYNMPVFFVDIQRVKRGYYTLELSLIAENPSALEPGELTRRYAKKLEEAILKKPENWLWSHKRWKLNE
ncbi:MAG: lysophospholipid acyltransferase family protein, partial [Bacteroidetes bacterium]|nr:lysophospholipid acyltransferase family protein [Bacteroidota bacterium]